MAITSLVALLPACAQTASAEPSRGCERYDAAFAASGTSGLFTDASGRRTYNLTIPPGPRATPRPLVLNLHGATVSDDDHDRISRVSALGIEEGFITLTPEAAPPVRAWDLDVDGPDRAFLLALLDEAEQRVCVDTTRVYVTGFSLGAIFASVLACHDADRFAAVAPVAGVVFPQDCGDDPVPVIAFHGVEDEIVELDGSYDPDVGEVIDFDTEGSREDQIGQWAAHNGCDGDPQSEEVSAHVRRIAYECGADVELYVVDEAGHTWPGSPAPTGFGADEAGGVTDEIDATALMWDFFEDHAR